MLKMMPYAIATPPYDIHYAAMLIIERRCLRLLPPLFADAVTPPATCDYARVVLADMPMINILVVIHTASAYDIMLRATLLHYLLVCSSMSLFIVFDDNDAAMPPSPFSLHTIFTPR